MKKIIHVFLLLTLVVISSFSLDIPKPNGFINDLAGILNFQEEDQLNQRVKKYEAETGVQIAILSIKTLDGNEINQYATRVFNEWGIGQKDKNNGILILHSTGDRKIFIATGRGIEGAIPDITAKHIVENDMAPYFKKSEFSNGYNKAIDSIELALKGEYKVKEPQKIGTFGIILIVILVLILVVFLIILEEGGGGGFGVFGSSGGSSGGGGGGFGGGSSGGGGGGGSY